jgi:hypothetical protein
MLDNRLARSIRVTVEMLTIACRARSRAVQPNKARAARTCAPEIDITSPA